MEILGRGKWLHDLPPQSEPALDSNGLMFGELSTLDAEFAAAQQRSKVPMQLIEGCVRLRKSQRGRLGVL
jgi:hypothetical protein